MSRLIERSRAGLATGGVTTAAQLATRAGLTLLVKTVAKNYAVEQAASWALTPVMGYASSLAASAGVSPTLVQAGMVGLQASGLVKGALPKATVTSRPRSGCGTA